MRTSAVRAPPGAGGAKFCESSFGEAFLTFANFCCPRPPLGLLPVLNSERLVLEQHSFTFADFGCPRSPWGGLRPPPQRGAAEGRPPVVSFVLALNQAHVLALDTAHALRLNKADVLALNPYVSTLRYAQCSQPTQRTTKGGRPKAAPLCGGGRRPPPLCWL